MANSVVDGILQWQPDADGADTNLPTNATQMDDGSPGDLDGELRRIKSEFRAESIAKGWERWRGLKNLAGNANIAFTYLSPTSFSVNDLWAGANSRGIASTGRQIRAFTNVVGTYGKITNAVQSAGATIITAAWASGAANIDPTLYEVQLGADIYSVPNHDALFGVLPNQHHPQLHQLQHTLGGTDPFTSGQIIDAMIRYVYANGEQLIFGGTADQQILFRSGVAITTISFATLAAILQGILSIGTPNIRSAAGSAVVDASLDGVAVGLNDWSFFPSFALTGVVTGYSHRLAVAGVADVGDTAGRVGLEHVATRDHTLVRWRYISASDNPTIWVAHDDQGAIKATWSSDDPLVNDQPGLVVPGMTVTKQAPAQLDQLSYSNADMAKATEVIKEQKLRQEHELYRALQAKTNDPAPAKWIKENCYIDGGKLKAK